MSKKNRFVKRNPRGDKSKKMSIITLELLSEIKAHLYPYDENTVHSLVMLYHNSLLQDLDKAGLLKPTE